ncbi:MAG: chloride channel protein [Bdellovibrio sp.]
MGQKNMFNSSLRLIPFFFASIISSLVAVFYSKAFFFAEEQSLKFILETHWSISLLFTVSAIYLSWFLPYRIATHAGGSGIPQMLIANELDPVSDKSLIRNLIGLRVITVKIVASLICVLGGGAVGQEGPTLQIAAGIFYRLGEKSTRWIKQVSPRTFILAGGASGLAAAFNTPLGGIAYALEELSKDTFNNFKNYVFGSIITTGLLVQALVGGYLYLGTPKIEVATIEIYFFVVCVAAISGLFGSVFGSFLYKIASLRRQIISFKKLSAVNLICGILFWSGIHFISVRSVGGGKSLIIDYLFKDFWSSPQDLMVRFLGPMLMAMAGVAGGLFAPSLAIGASVGSVVAHVLGPHAHHILVIVGMIGFLTGFMKTPFTAFILIFEMTDRHTALFPMMIAAVVALGVAKVFQQHSFYELIKEDFFHSENFKKQHENSLKNIEEKQ